VLQLIIIRLQKYICTIVDFFCENGISLSNIAFKENPEMIYIIDLITEHIYMRIPVEKWSIDL
jgi:hypothetical protein